MHSPHWYHYLEDGIFWLRCVVLTAHLKLRCWCHAAGLYPWALGHSCHQVFLTSLPLLTSLLHCHLASSLAAFPTCPAASWAVISFTAHLANPQLNCRRARRALGGAALCIMQYLAEDDDQTLLHCIYMHLVHCIHLAVYNLQSMYVAS